MSHQARCVARLRKGDDRSHRQGFYDCFCGLANSIGNRAYTWHSILAKYTHIAVAPARLGRFSDQAHHPDRFNRKGAFGGFTAQHHGIGSITAAFTLDSGPDRIRPAPAVPTRTPDSTLDQFDVPLVFGMTTAEAARAVKAAGFSVQVKTEPDCTEVPGRVLSATADHTGVVTISVPDPGVGYCAHPPTTNRRIAWQVIDLATGRGPGPPIFPGVSCCDQDVLARLARAATQWVPTDGIFNIPPVLVTRPYPGGFEMVIGEQWTNGRVDPLARAIVELQDGKVTMVRRGNRHMGIDPGPPPDDEAAVAGTQELVAMIRTGKPYPIDGVDLYVEGRRQPSADGSWKVCPDIGVGCPVDASALIRGADELREQVGQPDLPCAPARPLELDGLVLVTVTPTTYPNGCGDEWAVQLWWTAQGELKAINVLLGEP